MRLKEIKLEALRIMGCSAVVDGVDLVDLEQEEECRDYLAYMPGAINRCLSNLESRDVLPKRQCVLAADACERYGDRVRYSLGDMIPDLFKVERIAREDLRGGYQPSADYVREGEKTVLGAIGEDERYIVIYWPRIGRITGLTDNETEIDVPDHIAALIPYFVKAELFRFDEPDEAQEAKNWYEGCLMEISYEAEGVQGRVSSVYCMDNEE